MPLHRGPRLFNSPTTLNPLMERLVLEVQPHTLKSKKRDRGWPLRLRKLTSARGHPSKIGAAGLTVSGPPHLWPSGSFRCRIWELGLKAQLGQPVSCHFREDKSAARCKRCPPRRILGRCCENAVRHPAHPGGTGDLPHAQQGGPCSVRALGLRAPTRRRGLSEPETLNSDSEAALAPRADSLPGHAQPLAAPHRRL